MTKNGKMAANFPGFLRCTQTEGVQSAMLQAGFLACARTRDIAERKKADLDAASTQPHRRLASALLPTIEMRLAWCPTVRSHKLTHLWESQNSPQNSPKIGQKELQMGENVKNNRKTF